MRVVAVDPAEPREDRLNLAVDVLTRGGIVALPTETFYGLAADTRSASALGRINAIKHKPDETPVLLLAASTEQARSVTSRLPASFNSLAERFWPGPLTLLVPAAAELPREVSGGRGTVALRVPGLALPRRLAAALGRPISGPSANLWQQPPARTAAEVARALGEHVDLILDGGPTPGGSPSTIVDLTVEPPRTLRAGAVPAAALRRFLPTLDPHSVQGG